MASHLDMSLDQVAEMSKKKKPQSGGGRGRGGSNNTRGQSRGRGGGSGRGRNNNRQSGNSNRGGRWESNKSGRGGRNPYSREAQTTTWGHDQYERLQSEGDHQPRRFKSSKSTEDTTDNGSFGTKIEVSNLKFDVLEPELTTLFSKVAPPIQCKVKYDKTTGRSSGTATLIFKSSSEAQRAINEYNGRTIDGQPMVVKELGRRKLGNRF